jgi:hypothetical protein
VEDDEAGDPVNVSFFGTDGVMFEAEGIANSVEEPGLGLVRWGGESHREPISIDIQ